MSTGSTGLLYLGTDSNKLLVVKDGEVIQSIHPVAPNPLGLPEGVYNGISTEWVSCHPRFPVVYALTSYWNASEACVTTFQIQKPSGKLIRLGESSSTHGLHAAHATFSPDGNTFVMAHHNDGKLVFFDCSNGAEALPSKPILVIETPEVNPGRRRITKPKDAFPGLPSLHHVQYSPSQKCLVTVDPSQDYIFTYTVNEQTGLPISRNPQSKFKCYSDVPIYGYFQRLITQCVLKCKRRARKTAIHPNGKYIYVLYESLNRIQVYKLVDDLGTIDFKISCCQEVSTLDPAFFKTPWCRPVGIALQLAAELYVTNDGSTLLVSNRGDIKVPGSRAESGIRVFSIHQDGQVLQPQGALDNIQGPVRHFLCMEDTSSELVAAVCQSGGKSYLQSFRQEKGKHNSKGDERHYEYAATTTISVPENVFCIAHHRG
ncbi:Pfam:Muc_lac_enz [Seminavis robusta]|uniref:Pfam:Muc_lac_enz n=1 Tax=Seminavis robusta TaxID=568900 RepID=A0A9N8DG62_9STRA|nr:Pfam:Muc_lac_enz [Seminavis robusta]|eukprot:Sro75_g041280.1 Pfam:Muc_lac_enz (430) ;mRNA; r:75100-76389